MVFPFIIIVLFSSFVAISGPPKVEQNEDEVEIKIVDPQSYRYKVGEIKWKRIKK